MLFLRLYFLVLKFVQFQDIGYKIGQFLYVLEDHGDSLIPLLLGKGGILKNLAIG